MSDFFIQEKHSAEYLLNILQNKDLQIDAMSEKIKHLEAELEEANKRILDEQKSAMKILASRLAHDLRNPLSTIKNVVEILEVKRNLSIEDKLIRYKKLNRAVDRISHQIDDVLEFVKEQKLHKEFCIIADLIHLALIDLVVPNDIKINVDKTMISTECDQQKMISVFANLILNAVQSVESKGIINVKISEDSRWIKIQVEDSGPGIPDDKITKIFEPLYTTKQQGTGLGLSICKNIVEQHDGKISVFTNPTIFEIMLPKK